MMTGAKLLAFAIPLWQGTPNFGIEDAYKWLFHATQGGEHAIADPAGPTAWMDREWASLDKPLAGEPMVTWLRPDHRLLRLNLRPFRAAGGTKADALSAFIASAKQFRPNRDEFGSVWKLLRKRLASGALRRVSVAEWDRLDRDTRTQGYPAIDHSSAFLGKAKPAYRVLTKKEWLRIQPSTLSPKRQRGESLSKRSSKGTL